MFKQEKYSFITEPKIILAREVETMRRTGMWNELAWLHGWDLHSPDMEKILKRMYEQGRGRFGKYFIPF